MREPENIQLCKSKQGSFKDGMMNNFKCYVDLKVYEEEVNLSWCLVTTGNSFEGDFSRLV